MQLYRRWVDAWNGDFAAVDEIITDDFVFHREHGQPEVKGPKALRALLEGSRGAFSSLKFTTQLGPIVDDKLVVGRNIAKGLYAGGMPGASAPSGTPVSLTGIDILRITDDKISECWHNGNDLAFMIQLGAVHMNDSK
jgi:predicted ester cyclase